MVRFMKNESEMVWVDSTKWIAEMVFLVNSMNGKMSFYVLEGKFFVTLILKWDSMV